MMKYIVLSPSHHLIGFNSREQVVQYCLKMDNESLSQYASNEELTYETMTPTEIGQLYTQIGAVYGGCHIYKSNEILQEMVHQDAEAEDIEKAKALFAGNDLKREIPCPGFIEDILGEMTPIPQNEMSDGIYYMNNIDAPSDEKDNG